MNDHALPRLGANFTISNRPAAITTWTPGADQHCGSRNGDHLDFVESVQGKGQPTGGPDKEGYRVRYASVGGNATRGTLAGIVEALRCALGISKDRGFINFVMSERQRVYTHCEEVIGKYTDNSNKGQIT